MLKVYEDSFLMLGYQDTSEIHALAVSMNKEELSWELLLAVLSLSEAITEFRGGSRVASTYDGLKEYTILPSSVVSKSNLKVLRKTVGDIKQHLKRLSEYQVDAQFGADLVKWGFSILDITCYCCATLFANDHYNDVAVYVISMMLKLSEFFASVDYYGRHDIKTLYKLVIDSINKYKDSDLYEYVVTLFSYHHYKYAKVKSITDDAVYIDDYVGVISGQVTQHIVDMCNKNLKVDTEDLMYIRNRYSRSMREDRD